MSYTDWKDKTTTFKRIDVRGIQGNFFQGLKNQAMIPQKFKRIINIASMYGLVGNKIAGFFALYYSFLGLQLSESGFSK